MAVRSHSLFHDVHFIKRMWLEHGKSVFILWNCMHILAECFCFIGRFFLIKQKRLSAYVSSTYAKSLVPHIWIIRHTLFVTKTHCHLTYTRHVTMRFTILRVCWLHGYNYSLLTRSSYHTVFSPSRSNWVFCVKKMKSYENTKPAMLPPAYWHPRS